MSLGIQNCHSLGVEVVRGVSGVWFSVGFFSFFSCGGGFFVFGSLGFFFEMYINRAYLLFPDGDRKVKCPSEKLTEVE